MLLADMYGVGTEYISGAVIITWSVESAACGRGPGLKMMYRTELEGGNTGVCEGLIVMCLSNVMTFDLCLFGRGKALYSVLSVMIVGVEGTGTCRSGVVLQSSTTIEFYHAGYKKAYPKTNWPQQDSRPWMYCTVI